MLKYVSMDTNNVHGVALLEHAAFGDKCWSEQLFIDEIGQENKHYFVCMDGNIVVAYGGYAQVLDEGHIMNIAVDAAYRRRGIAEYILGLIFKDAFSRGVTAVTLEVRESNLPARSLYEKVGFKSAGVRKNYYEMKENAYIYWRVL